MGKIKNSSDQRILQAMCATSDGLKRQEIVWLGERILSVGEIKTLKENCDYFYDNSYLLFPGFIDIHVHGREDETKEHCYKEDFLSLSRAAISGGVTCVADMPNNLRPPIDDKSYQNKLKLTKKGEISIILYAGIGPGTRPLKNKVPYKAYMGPSVGELYFKTDEELEETLKYYEGKWVSFHCEDPLVLEKHRAEKTHMERRPEEAEILATKTALRLIKKYNLKGKLCHYSTKKGLEYILNFKKENPDLSIQLEVTPQHLYYSQELLKKLKEKNRLDYFQMNPPIRREIDRPFLLEKFREGKIDFLATDHAPHSKEEKEKGTSGLPGLDTYGGFVCWCLNKAKISVEVLLKACCERPGDFINEFIDKEKPHQGYLREGYAANFCVLDRERPKEVCLKDLETKAMDSPFLGEIFPGRVHHVFEEGELKSKLKR